MAHLVLARKYRPKFFSEVVGQDGIVATLTSAIEKNRVADAMLFTGGRGIGKTTIARIFAKALVCLARQGIEPCGKCVQCQAIDNFSSLDVIEIDGASHTGVDDIRDLRESARYQPATALLKIFIIDEVHMLSTSAFNALLKILEEPPRHVKFIFATTEVHKIPKTVLSRCQRYDFKRMSVDTIYETLKTIMKADGFLIEDRALKLIASLADGALRDALSLTEQIVSHGQDHYSLEFVAQCFGVVNHASVVSLCEALLFGQVDAALLLVKELYESSYDLCQLMDAIAERFRMLSLCAHVDKAKALVICPEITESDLEMVKSHDKADLKRLFAMAIDGTAQVFQAQRPIHALELFVLRSALRPPMSDAVTINYCLQKLDAIMHNRPLPERKGLPIGEDKTPKRLSSSEKIEDPPKAFKETAGHDVSKQFNELIERLKAEVPLLASHLRLARPELDADKKVLTLHFEQSLHYEQALFHKEHLGLKQVLESIIGSGYSWEFRLKQLDPSALKTIKTPAQMEEEVKTLEKEALLEKARQNPLVIKALEIFGGDITDVKRT